MNRFNSKKFPYSQKRTKEKNTFLSSIIAFSDDAIIKTTVAGIVTDLNPAAEKMYGFSEKEIVGQSIAVLAHSQGVNEIFKSLEKIKKSKCVEHSEVIRKRKDGTEIYVSLNMFPVKDAEGLVVGASTIAQDITERKQTEKALRESEIRYRRLFEAAQDGILILDADTGRIIDINPFLLEMLGYSFSEVIGKALWEIGAFKDISINKVNFAELQSKEYVRYEDIPLETKEGMQKQVEFVSNVYLVGGKKTIQCNIRDITDHRQAEENLNLFFNVALDMLCIADFKGYFVRLSPTWTKTLGWTEKELKAKPFVEFVHPDDRKATLKAASHLSEGIEVVGFENRYQCKDGSYKWISWNSFGVIDRGLIIAAARDITDRKRVEKTLKKNEAKLKELFECAPVGYHEIDKLGNISAVNQTELKMLGYSYEEMIGWPVWEFISKRKESRERVLDKLAGNLPPNKSFEQFFIRRDETSFPALVDDVVLRNELGVITGIRTTILDITDRKRAEEHLQESEERYRRLVEFSPDAIMVHSCGKFVYVNPAAVILLGAHDASELLGKPVLDIIHPDYRESVRFRVTTGIIENRIFPLMEEKFLRMDGAVIDVEVAALPIEYDGIPAMQDVVRDITEQKKLQQELFQSQKIQSIGTLAGGIAHDFNNILGIILGYTSLIENHELDSLKQSESIAAINQAVQRGAALVRQILTFARKTDVSFEPLSLEDLVQELLSMLKQTFPKIITFEKIFPKDIPFILADRTQIHQALLNLCVNARDAMPNGGSLIVKAEKQTGKQLKEQYPTADQDFYICISVTDTGEGMNEATRCRIFDPFFTTKPKGKGTGLGLSVVYGVVQAHQGFINVESKLGYGTTFRLYFPIPIISEKQIDARQIEPFEIGGTETILLVEDEELLIEMVRFLLESKGYKVLVAQDGMEAIEVYKKNRQEIALVLTDMGLPLIAGIEEFKKLKEIDPNVKIILASGFFEPDVKSELLKAGAKGFLQKPYMPDEILRVSGKFWTRKYE